MDKDADALVLEIFRHQDQLKMSLFNESEFISTIRHYSQLTLEPLEIQGLAQEVIATLNKASRDPSSSVFLINNLKKTGQILWDHLLVKSVKSRLRLTSARDLVVCIDEELINVPWELLYDGSDFLCLKFNIGRLIRTKGEAHLPQYRSISGKLKMLVLANPTNDLKSAYQEGLYIRNQFDRQRNQVGIDFKSTNIDTLYVKKNLRDYDLVHFAGHCEYDLSDPQNSGWVLSDGKFSSRDIVALAESISLPSLVFSNACHSAEPVGDLLEHDYQEKTYSLASAFLFSGVRHYIGTLRKIEDRVSLVFAKEFYSLLISGKSVGESLRQARLKLVKQYGITSIFWASYLLYGDPRFTFFKAKVKAVKKRSFVSKKRIIGFSVIAAFLFLSISLSMWLPSLNPNAYILLAKSQKSFVEGRNTEVIANCKRLVEKDPLVLAAYPLLADTYRRLGDKKNALKYYFDYALYSEKRNDKKNLASAYISIGWFYHLGGDYEKAINFYNKALGLSRENKDKLNEADALGKTAIWYMDKRDYDKALELLTKSSEINRERQNIYKHRYNLACDYFNLGLLFTDKDDFVTAREFYDKSFRLFSKLKLNYELSDYYFNMGEIYSFQKEYQKAIDYYNRGIKIDLKHANMPSLAADYNMAGELYLEMDNLSQAEAFFNQAIALSKQIDARPELASSCYNLGRLYKQQGKKNKARECLRQAQEIYSKIDLLSYEDVKKELLGLSSD